MPAKRKTKKTVKKSTRRSDRKLASMPGAELIDRLAEVGRIGSLFIEGEDVVNLLQPECREWTDPDDINFDGAIGARVKKTLLRIEQVDPELPYHAILWKRRTDDPSRIEVMLAGSMNSSYSLGKRENPEIWPEIRKCLDKGVGVRKVGSNPRWEASISFRYGHVGMANNDSLIRAGGRVVSWFQPIRDSRGDVVAALELTCVGTDG